MDSQFPQPSGSNYYRMPEKKPKKRGLAITSFVLSLLPVLLSILCCCCCCCCATNTVVVNVYLIILLIMSILAFVSGIISLVSHRDGKGFAITGIIISAFMILPLIFSLICVNTPYYKDMIKFTLNAQEYIDEYEETGEVPEDFEKYNDPKYDWLWQSMGMNSFSDFYGQFIQQYKEQNSWYLQSPYNSGSSGSESNGSSSNSSESSPQETTTRPANYGEDPITI